MRETVKDQTKDRSCSSPGNREVFVLYGLLSEIESPLNNSCANVQLAVPATKIAVDLIQDAASGPTAVFINLGTFVTGFISSGDWFLWRLAGRTGAVVS